MELSSKPAEYQLVAGLAAEINRRDFAVSVAKEARTRGVEMIDYLYPVIKLPDGNNPEPALLLGLIRQESAFDVGAVSAAGAKGLMQLMPGTAKDVAKKIGVKYAEKRLTTDAQLQRDPGPRLCRRSAEPLRRLLHPDRRGLQCRAEPGARLDLHLWRPAPAPTST